MRDLKEVSEFVSMNDYLLAARKNMIPLKLSIIIPCKNLNDPKLQELLASIDRQDFPKEEMETLIVTEGTSESAKAIGIKRAKGEVIGILASDNELIGSGFLQNMYNLVKESYINAAYPGHYYYAEKDDIPNRYFALIGGNDPLAYYMGKNDRSSYLDKKVNENSAIGDNGFFVKRGLISKTDLDNYYHIDNAHEIGEIATKVFGRYIWHKTGGNLFSFFRKRYRYGLQHAFNPNRRWHLVDFRQPKDIVRLIWFILCSLTIIQPLLTSFRGYLKIRDVAWFLHFPVCLMTVFTYGILILHLGLKRLFQLFFAPMAAQRA